ncbi:membrane-spanning 4-domains subfamily A member 4D-like [Panthera uncia]|uniref:membrane-spanning 4-domains subfamily A member 4D-like n=1 Tax=Panthera uncia TaxID=29064 RepID=UPI0020FF8F04|nr:membrane-spanning 4-domains subfamily A member 4D-like [Panthera uncia]
MNSNFTYILNIMHTYVQSFARVKRVRTGTPFLILFQICSSLGTNTLAAILAGVSLIILAIRTEVSSHFLSETVLARYFLIGIMIMKLILIILGLIVSVLLSAFGCSAVCCDVTSVVVDLSSNDCGVAVASLYHYYDDVAFQHA